MTLSDGFKSGKFLDRGELGDMSLCQKHCCKMARCDAAFMAGKRCFSVSCHSEEACQWVPASKVKHVLQLSYVTSPHKIRAQDTKGIGECISSCSVVVLSLLLPLLWIGYYISAISQQKDFLKSLCVANIRIYKSKMIIIW